MQAPAPALGGGAAAPLSGVAAAGGSVAAPASSGGGGGSATMPIPITKAQKSTILSTEYLQQFGQTMESGVNGQRDQKGQLVWTPVPACVQPRAAGPVASPSLPPP